MLELIFGWLLKIAINFTEGLLNLFNRFLDLSLTQIVEYFPFLATGLQMFQVISIGFVAMIAIVGLFRFFAGPMAEAKESPTTILIRSAVAIFSIFYGGYLINWAVGLAKIPYDAFVALDATDVSNMGKTVIDGINSFIEAAGKEAIFGAVGIPPYLNIALSLFLIVAIAWNVFKLIIEICERYLMVGVLAYTSPLMLSTIASEGTSSIFKRWLGMFSGQLIIMTLSVWSYDLVISGFSSLIADHQATTGFLRLILIFAACRIGLRVDTYMQQLGIGVGTTGGSLLDETMGIAHTLGSFMRNNGGSHNEGKASNSVLGGHMDSKGNVRPDPIGTGLLGAVATGGRYGMAAFRNGGSAGDVMAAAKEGAGKGFGFGRQKDGTFDTSIVAGRRLGGRFSNFQQDRINARSPATSEMYGGAAKSADGTTSHLDQTAKDNGLKLDKNNSLQGDVGVSGGFMAANMGKESAHDILSQTARQGDPAASEKALFGTHNNLSHDATSADVSKGQFDQLGSDMLAASMSGGMQALEQKQAEGKPLTQDEKNVLAAGSVMSTSMASAAEKGSPTGAHLTNFQASDVGTDGGRSVSAGIVDAQGKNIGEVSALNQKGFDSLSKEQQAGYVPMTSSSGETYYMKSSLTSAPVEPGAREGKTATAGGVAGASGGAAVSSATGSEAVVKGSAPAGMGDVRGTAPVVAASERGGREDAPDSFFNTTDAASPEISSVGAKNNLSIKRSGGKQVIQGDDALYTAAAISEGLSHPNYAVNQLAKDTVHSPEMTEGVAEHALFSEHTQGIPTGHDPEMATMMNKVFTGDDLGGAIGSVKDASGEAIMSSEDASQFAGALKRAADGVDDGSGYQVKNISTSSGVVSCEYSTPSGNTYQIQAMEADRTEPIPEIESRSVDVVGGGTNGHYNVAVSQMPSQEVSAPAPASSSAPASAPTTSAPASGSGSAAPDSEPQSPSERDLGKAGQRMYDESAHPDLRAGGVMDAKNTGKKKRRGRRR